MADPKEAKKQEAGDEITLEKIISPLWVNAKYILLFSFAVAIVTLGINFLLPTYYRSTATLLPETEKNKLSALGQFADVAALAGVNIPGSEIARLYPSILTSETVLIDVIGRKYENKKYGQPVNLIEYYDLDNERADVNMERALGRLRGDMSASVDLKTSIVTVSVEMKDPDLAANVLNALVERLDSFMRLKRITNASEQVRWIETRLKEVDGDLKRSENSLKNFREKNRRVADSPELLLQQERLAREVQVNSTVFIELKKQYELAKLEEIKNLSIVNVLDAARVPALKAGPKRATNTLLSFIIGFLVASAYVVFVAVYGTELRSYVDSIRRPAGRRE